MSRSKNTDAAISQDVVKLRRTLQPELNRYPLGDAIAPYLVVLSGLPGTGKSHFANALAGRTPFIIVGSDRMRKTLVSNPQYDRAEHERVFTACHLLIEGLLQEGYRVIFDATNLTEGFRQSVYEISDRTNTRLNIIWFTAPTGVVRQRLDARAAGRSFDSHSDADWSIYCRLRPGEEPISRHHLKIDSSQEITSYLDQIVHIVNSSSATAGC